MYAGIKKADTYYTMKVVKRNGDVQEMLFDKVTKRISKLNQAPEFEPLNVQPDKVAQKVFTSMYDGISTSEIDNLTAEVAVAMITEHPDYETLAMRVTVSNLQKNCPTTFSAAMAALHAKGVISDDGFALITPEMDVWIDDKRDYLFGYFGIKTLQKGYLNEGETPQYLFMRVALWIHGGDAKRTRETYDLMSQKYFTHATPTLFNSLSNNSQGSSCFLVAMKDDSIEGIYETLKECAHISKWSGGIGIHCSNIRANGSPIKGTNGVADGIVPMLRVFNNTARYVNQGGGKRKGSFAIYLEPWHADIMEFLELRLNQGDEEMRCRDLFTAMWIPDLFMEKVEKDEEWHLMCPHECPGLPDVYGEEFNELYRTYVAQGRFKKAVKARLVWDAILKSQVETGTPYMCYKDSVNSKSNQKNIGTIKSSNLCVAPETMILTKNGYQKISDLVGQVVDVWNGEEWSAVTASNTSAKSRLVRVNFSDGTFLECTEYHKFHLQIGYGSKTEIKPTTSLVPGDRLIKWTPPSPVEFEYTEEFEYPYTHGFFCGDGTYHSTYSGFKTIPGVSLYGEKKKLVEHLEVRTMSGEEDASGRLNVQLPYDLPNKFKVPLRGTVKTRLDWFAGLCDADGHTQGCPGNPTQKSVSVASIHMNFLRDIQLMLHTLGVSSVIGLHREAGESELPDGKGGKKMFETQTCWRLVVSALGVETLINAGFTTHRLDLSDFTPVTRDVRQYVRVVSIEDNGRMDATYCFNEPKRHMGIFNGVITGNCTEIMEVSGPDETAVCNLASICLPSFVKNASYGSADGSSGTTPYFDFGELHGVTRVITRNLNRVIDNNYYPTEAARKSNMRHRPIGIGVQGLADVFQMLGLSFDEPKARKLNTGIFEAIYHAALTESCELAKEEGPYETFQGSPASQGILQQDMWGVQPNEFWNEIRESIKTHGLRNSLLVAPMPTASTAQIMGNNEAFEPYTTNIYLRRTLAGEFVMINKHLVRELMSLGKWTPEIKTEIVRAGGSVQNLDGVPDKLKEVYRTVWEISQKSIIEMSADRGAYIDQSQSLNIFMENPSMAKLSSMHLFGWKKGLKTGAYYLRTRAKARAQQVTVPVMQKPTEEQVLACSLANPESCEMCSG
jgi:ribonucleoside-diphosphate reductase alpha chain